MYSDTEAAKIRRHNLNEYLEFMLEKNPLLLLLDGLPRERLKNYLLRVFMFDIHCMGGNQILLNAFKKIYTNNSG